MSDPSLSKLLRLNGTIDVNPDKYVYHDLTPSPAEEWNVRLGELYPDDVPFGDPRLVQYCLMRSVVEYKEEENRLRVQAKKKGRSLEETFHQRSRHQTKTVALQPSESPVETKTFPLKATRNKPTKGSALQKRSFFISGKNGRIKRKLVDPDRQVAYRVKCVREEAKILYKRMRCAQVDLEPLLRQKHPKRAVAEEINEACSKFSMVLNFKRVDRNVECYYNRKKKELDALFKRINDVLYKLK